MKIGVFDSGVGGLTVLKGLVENFKNDYIYVADLKNSPYGEKTDEQLKQILIDNLEFFVSKKVDVIIIACGTLSSIALKLNIHEYKGIRVLDVITAIKHNLIKNNYENIVLMATLSTIMQGNFKNIIKDNAKNIIECACVDFVPLIEGKNSTKEERLLVVKKYLTDDIKNKIQKNSAIILGCTHYPILLDEIKEVSLIDDIILPSNSMVEYINDKCSYIKNDNLSLEICTNKETDILKKFVNDIFGYNKITKI